MSDPRYARSFETIAEQYERARPEYAEEAVDWLVARLALAPGARVLDLGAGTGKLTRQLLRRELDVVAVEPGDAMRDVLERVLPAVETLAGTAEAIPLPDDSVDAIAVGQAFHWFDSDAAFAEFRRVLRPAGGFALLWNQWDPEDPALAAVDRLLAPHRPPLARDPTPFEAAVPVPLEERRFRQRRAMTLEQIEEWAASTSGFVNAAREDQAAIRAGIRVLEEDYAGEVSIVTEVLVGQFSDGSSGMRATSS